MFGEHGYDASLDLIAKQTGVGPGTLHRHFPSRDDLMDAVMTRRRHVAPGRAARGGVATVADQSDLDPAAVRPMLEVVADGLLK